MFIRFFSIFTTSMEHAADFVEELLFRSLAFCGDDDISQVAVMKLIVGFTSNSKSVFLCLSFEKLANVDSHDVPPGIYLPDV